MTPTIQLAANKSYLPCSNSSSRQVDGDDDDVVRQLVMGRWRSSLSSGLRAALACTIVGLVSLYAPAAVRRHITFPAFSYVVTVIIVTDATLGTALRGAVSALHGSLMGAAPSVAALWLAHRAGAAESVAATAAVTALTAFAVALPESVCPVAKRIALGQAIIIYVARFRQGERPGRALALLHPANVVACTALGAAAALLAVLLPWPRMATREARDKSRDYRVLAAERVRVMVDAATAAFAVADNGECSRQRRWRMAACMAEAKRLASASTALLNRINAIKEDLQWERAVAVGENKSIISIEMPLAGMQIALEIMMPQAAIDDGHGHKDGEDMVGLVMAMRDQIRLALLTTPNNNKHSSRSLLFGSTTDATTASLLVSHLSLLPTTSYDYNQQQQQQQLAPFLFIFSLYQLHRRFCGTTGKMLAAAAAIASAKQVAPAAATTMTTDLLPDEQEEEQAVEHQVGQQDDDPQQAAEPATAGEDDGHYCCRARATTTTKHDQHWWPWPRRQVVAAAKCGFSLGLAVLLGLLFSNDHGFWSGLIVATTMTAGRESTWGAAAARAHGTALGSIYGVLGCLLMSQQQRLLTMDLRFLALLPWMVLAAFLRRSRAYGPAGGVAAALSVVIIMGRRYDEAPMAFAMARLVETFIGIACAVLADLMFQPGARPSAQVREQLARCVAALLSGADDDDDEHQVQVQQELALLRKYAAEAGGEPTYLWLPPFPAACYDKIQVSLGRMAQLLQLYHQARSSIMYQVQVNVDDDTNTDAIAIRRSLSHCLRMLQAPPRKEGQQVIDLEAGIHGVGCSCRRHIQDEAKLLLLDENDDSVQQQEERLLVVCSLASIALCRGEILKEAQHLEAHILDLNSLQLTDI